MSAPPRLHFHVPPRPSHLLRARDRIRDYLRQYCTERQVVDDVVLCIEEAATNAIRHSDSDHDIDISLRFADGELLAEVKDRGRGFDPASFDRDALPDVLSDHGRGLFIIAKLMDSLELNVNSGLRVRMTRRAETRCEPSPVGSGLIEPRAAFSTGQGGDRTRAMLDELEEGFIALDWEYRYVHANRAALHVSGRSLEELLGRTPWEVFPELETAPLRELYRQAMERGEPSVSEHLSIFDDTWREMRIYPTITGINAYFNDITERKRAELQREELLAALRDSEERYRGLFQSESDALLLIDHESGRVLEANPAAAAAYGYTTDELLGLTDIDLSAEPELTRSTTQSAEVGENVAVPTRLHRRKDGTTFAVEMTGRVFSLQGRMVRVVAVRDVTARKQAEEVLGRFELLAANSRDIILFMDRDGRIIEANAAAERAYGYTRDQLLKLSVADLRASQTEADIAPQMEEADERGILFESLHRRRDGSTFPVEVSSRGATVGGRRTLVSVVRDISERKRAESELRESDARLRALFENLQDSFYLAEIVRDAEGTPSDYRFLEVNRAFEELMSSDRTRLVGQLASEAVKGLDHAWVSVLGEVADSGTPVRYCRYSNVFERYFEILAFRPAAGQVGVIVSDVTQQREAQERADHEHQTLAAILEGSPAGALYLDRAFTIRIVNRQLERNAGVTRDRLVGRNYFEVMPEAGLRRFLERARDAGRAVELSALPMEMPARPDRGVTYWDWKVQPVTNAAGQVEGLVLSSIDVTAEVRSQRLSDALSRISLKLADAGDQATALEDAGKLAVDALGCDTFLAARLDASQWTPLQSTGAAAPVLARDPDRWPESQAGLGTPDVSQVADWQADVRVNTPWKQAWRLQACLFAPLVNDGRLTGGLFFGMRERPRLFDVAEREFARRCATIIAVTLDNLRLTGDLERAALTLQENLLRPLPSVPGLQFASVSQPAYASDLVGGDFHDAFLADDDHVVLLVGDVTGKGLGAAGLTETVRTAVRAFAAIDHAPDYVMRKTSELLLRHEAARNQFVTAFMVTIDLRSGALRYTSAGHPPAAQVSGRQVGYLPTQFAPPLGVWTDDFPVAGGSLAVGDMLVLYTDGVTESRSAQGMFGERRVLRAVRQCAHGGVQDVAEGLRDAAVKFGGTLRDDLEILAVRFVGRADAVSTEGDVGADRNGCGLVSGDLR